MKGFLHCVLKECMEFSFTLSHVAMSMEKTFVFAGFTLNTCSKTFGDSFYFMFLNPQTRIEYFFPNLSMVSIFFNCSFLVKIFLIRADQTENQSTPTTRGVFSASLLHPGVIKRGMCGNPIMCLSVFVSF